VKNIIESINRVLADWNPIGVDDEIAIEEYKGYIPLILKAIENKQELMNCLEDILINRMEIGYDPSNMEHIKDLQGVCERLIQIYQIAKASS